MSYYYVHKQVCIPLYKHSFYKVLCEEIPGTHILININYYKFVHFWRKLAELLEYKYNPFGIRLRNLVLINHNLEDTYFHMFCHFWHIRADQYKHICKRFLVYILLHSYKFNRLISISRYSCKFVNSLHKLVCNDYCIFF